ncbi:MAG TPA: ATP-binding protein [Steroidobacteraceae bacterium]|jgi:nitrogen fixation/metabolism regulation signal transduction histidine kinase
MRYSLEGRFALVCVGLIALAIGVAASLFAWLESLPLVVVIALLVVTPLAVLAARQFTRPVVRTMQAVSDGITSMKDRDFSVSITAPKQVELRSLVEGYNGLGDLLRAERQGLYQRELLLDTVIQATPLAMVLTNANDRVVYSNVAARQTFLGGRKLEGFTFGELLESAPEALRHAVETGADTLFTIESADESEIYHLSQRAFLLNSQSHRLYLLKQLTRELSRQEVETWKKVIRVIAHELNNSLAPISSLAHSGRQTADHPQPEQLERIFRTIEDRARHLHTFIDGYARFAKLPRPQPEAINWSAFLHSLQETAPFKLTGNPPTRPGVFDPTQMEQVLINLVKNAREAGATAESIELDVNEFAGGWRLQVCDRGSGMSEDVLRNALLPFFSTKPAGAGLGLTVCREVIEAHGGRVSLANRHGGGLAVSLWIPGIGGDESGGE